jgi:DtxR family Mn-dependent transcriptional regulator
MSSITLAFSSKSARAQRWVDPTAVRPVVPLSTLAEGIRAEVVAVRASDDGRADRLLALGVTPGARVVMLQTFPGIVFLCDQTELAIERSVAHSIMVRREEISS